MSGGDEEGGEVTGADEVDGEMTGVDEVGGETTGVGSGGDSSGGGWMSVEGDGERSERSESIFRSLASHS